MLGLSVEMSGVFLSQRHGCEPVIADCPEGRCLQGRSGTLHKLGERVARVTHASRQAYALRFATMQGVVVPPLIDAMPAELEPLRAIELPRHGQYVKRTVCAFERTFVLQSVVWLFQAEGWVSRSRVHSGRVPFAVFCQ